MPRLFSFAFLPCAVINPQWLELPMSRINFYSPKDVRAIEVRLYIANDAERGKKAHMPYANTQGPDEGEHSCI